VRWRKTQKPRGFSWLLIPAWRLWIAKNKNITWTATIATIRESWSTEIRVSHTATSFLFVLRSMKIPRSLWQNFLLLLPAWHALKRFFLCYFSSMLIRIRGDNLAPRKNLLGRRQWPSKPVMTQKSISIRQRQQAGAFYGLLELNHWFINSCISPIFLLQLLSHPHPS